MKQEVHIMAELLTLAHLQEMLEGNRRLTIRTLEAFPEQELFSYTAPGMRPAAALFKEIIEMERAFLRGIATNEWAYVDVTKEVATKQGLLDACNALRSQTQAWWKQITVDRLLAVADDGFGWGPPMPNRDRLIYGLENEIHHRGQVYVYLRQLGVEPPVFYER
jgi:uncharacterized damage-inducible protein DinB